MNADSFSLKARRTTRIPLRIPIVLVFREDGTEKERSIDAWTLIVNVNGARVECKQLFEKGKEVILRVPHLGKSQKGSVVWRDAKANKNGGYECGIKLDKSENLWGVGFPPSDWTPKASGIDDLLPSKLEAAPSPEVEPSSIEGPTEGPTDRTACAEEQTAASAQAAPDSPAPLPIRAEGDVSVEGAPSGGYAEAGQEQAYAYQVVDLTQDLSESAAPIAMDRTQELLAGDITAEPASSVEPEPEVTNPLQEIPNSTTGERESWRLGITQEPFIQKFPTAPTQPTSAGGTGTASDRLSTIFHELVESALQQRIHVLVDGLAARMEVRIREIETAAVTQVEQRVADMMRSQSELLEGRTLEIVSSRQKALEKGVSEYLEDQEETARRTQQEMAQETSRVMCEEMSQTAASNRQYLAEQAQQIVSATRINLWQNVQQEMPALEQEVLARGKAQAEQAVTACCNELDQRLPERIQEAEQSVKQRMDRLVEERLSRFTADLTERTEQLQTESRARIELQIQEVWQQTSQAFLRHIVGELNQKKQAWLQEAQGSLRELSDQNVDWTRRRTTQLLKNLGTSLIERASEGDAGSEPVEATFGEQKDPQEMKHLIGAHVGE